MSIEYKKGDIFTTGLNVIGHGVNTQGAMAGGLALTVATKYPEVEKIYNDYCHQCNFAVGNMLMIRASDDLYIANMSTQEQPGPNASIENLEKSLYYTLGYIKNKPQFTGLALPHIGAGIGGLKTKDVLASIEKIGKLFPDVKIEVWEFAPTS